VNVLGAVPERLIDSDFEALDRGRSDPTVDAVTATSGEFDTEETDVDAGSQRVLESISRRGPSVDGKGFRIWRAHEAWQPRQQRGPGATAPVARCQHDKGKPSVESAVFVWQMPAYDFARPWLDLVANAEPLLDLLLSSVEWRGFRRHGSHLEPWMYGPAESRESPLE
jgi:hypothetical protein